MKRKFNIVASGIKISVGGEKCAEVMITDKLMMPYYNREKNPAKKVFRDLCEVYV